MTSPRINEAARLYREGMAHFREARWQEAIDAFTALRELTDSRPEVDTLIADAQLKLQLEQVEVPTSTPPPAPNPRRRSFLIGGMALIVLLIGAGALLYTQVIAKPASPPVASVAEALATAVPAPTATTRPTATPAPTATTKPAATAVPATAVPTATAEPELGTLIVRTSEGKPLTRMIGNVEVIMDASGSMLADLNGTKKIDVARSALRGLIAKLPAGTNVALRTYGHRRSDDCSDSELVTPLQPIDTNTLLQTVDGINPQPNGRTPLGLSLSQVADDLKGASGDTMVVLLSDGEETCNADPATVAADLHAKNALVRISVIGLDIGSPEARQRLSAIAEGGGGQYFDAGNAAQLTDALQQALSLNYHVMDERGNEVARGPLGTPAQLPAGTYTIDISGDVPLVIPQISVAGNKTTLIELSEQNGNLQAAITTDAKP